MRSIFLFVCFFALLTGCKKNDLHSDNFYSGDNNFMQILQVSYVGYTFMGGKTQIFNSANHNIDSIPMLMRYKEPSDFGGITFLQIPTYDTIFNGTIIWMGCGQIYYPRTFDISSSFNSGSSVVACPDSSQFQLVGPLSKSQMAPINYSAIWGAISHLDITSYMMQQNCKIGLYPYMPSVGIGDPNQWSWIVFLYK